MGRLAINKKIIIFTQLSAYSLIIMGLVFIFGRKAWWPNYYSPIYFGLIFLASAGLIILSQYIYKPPDRRRQESIVWLRLAMAAALVLNALGEIYFYQLYKYGFQYDKLIHFFNAFLFMAALTAFYEKWHNYNLRRALRTAFIVIVAGSLIWEMFEFLSDLFFKTTEFGIYGDNLVMDTTIDLLSNFLGIIIGSIFITWRGWGNLINKLAGFNRRAPEARALIPGRCFPSLAAK